MLQLRNLLRAHARPSYLRIGARQAHLAPPTVRHVRFKRPWLRPFFTKVFLYGTAFYLWSDLVLSRFDGGDTLGDDSQRTPNAEDATSRRGAVATDNLGEDEDEDDAPLFIPLTWPQLQEGELYKTSDPEWQQFVQLSNDPKKLQQLRHELAKMVLDSAGPQMAPILGSPLGLTSSWLVNQFPSRAPPTYVQSGLELRDDGVHWVQVSMPPALGDRLRVLMNPVHVALAIKDAYLVLLRRQMARFKDQDQPFNMLEMLKEDHTMSSSEGTSPLSSFEKPSIQSIGNVPPENAHSNESDPHPSSILSSLQRLPLPDLGPGSDLHLASIAFKLCLNEYQLRTPRTPRRGTFFISGPVGIKGPKGFCRFEVKGEYDPAKPGWHAVDITLKDASPRKQRALGDKQ